MHFFLFFVNFPCYSMENVHSSIVCKFSMFFNGKFASCHFPILFNGKFVFCHFPMLLNGIFAFCYFPMLFNGKLAFCHFPMLFNGNLRIEKLGGDVRTDVHTYGRT